MERVSTKTRKMVLSAILSGIIIVLGVTQIGFIPIGPIRATILHIPVIIGAIFGGPIVGAVVGLSFGVMSFLQAPTDPTFAPIWAIGGLREILLIGVTAIVPRVLIGIVSAYVFKLIKKTSKKTATIIFLIIQVAAFGFTIYNLIKNIQQGEAYWAYILIAIAILILVFVVFKNVGKYNMQVVMSTIAGTLTNTILFIFLAYNFFKYDFAIAFNLDVQTIKNLWLTAGVTNGLPELLVSIVLINYIAIGLFAIQKGKTLE
ncbi:MAG: ECF transporter S component [Clostridiales bacterium]|nr:ECF transporter S component [Clostridiales bacterium]